MQYKGFNFFDGIYGRQEGEFALTYIEFPGNTVELSIPAEVLARAGVGVGDRFSWMPISLSSKPDHLAFAKKVEPKPDTRGIIEILGDIGFCDE